MTEHIEVTVSLKVITPTSTSVRVSLNLGTDILKNAKVSTYFVALKFYL